jgi:hypothetical protein
VTAKNTHKPAAAKKAATTTPASTNLSLKTWQADLIACVLIFLAIFVLFQAMVVQGKVFSRGDDTESASSMNTFADKEAAVREYPMWNPYVFCGFPSLAAGAYSTYQKMGMPFSLAYRYLSPRYWADEITIRGLFFGGFGEGVHTARWVVSLFLYGGLGIYLLMRRLGFRPLIALFSGLLMAWNPYLISLATAAHGGKLMTFIYMPLVVLTAWNVLEKRRLLDLALLALVLGWQFSFGGHTQIIFYSFITIGIMYVVWAILELRERKSLVIAKPAALIAVAAILGFCVGAVWYIPLLKYTPFSIRGMGPAIAKAGEAAASGYSIADATQWSFSLKELVTFIVPSWFGLKSPYYWGNMPFTSSSFYFGIVPLLFAVLAFWGKKDKLFWGLLVVSIFSILLSLGSNFQIFYSLFFNYLPYFSKLRTPVLILLLVVLAGMIYAGYGLKFVLSLSSSEKWKRVFLVGMVTCTALLVLFAVTGDALNGLFGSFAKDGETAQYSAQQLAMLHKERAAMLHGDLLLALLFLGLAFAACWAKVTNKLKPVWFLAAVLLVTAVDLYRFAHQFFDPQPAGTITAAIQENAITDALRRDSGVYRVLPLGNMQDNRWAAWEIASIGGYHGAKMRSYQDMYDNVFFNGPDRHIPLNMPFFNAMNCKYFVTPADLPPNLNLELVLHNLATRQYLYKNPYALERAYFVDSLVVISDREQALRKIMEPSFLFNDMAVIDKPVPGPISPDANRATRITEYTPHEVKITAHTLTASFMVFSDAYYAPGWEALDNGQPTPIYKVNGFVRGLYLRPGEHNIVFHYAGKYEKRGVAVATVSHFIVWGLVIGAYLYNRRRRRAEHA